MMVGTVLICGGTLMAVLTAGLSKPTAVRTAPLAKRQYMGETVNIEYIYHICVCRSFLLYSHCVHKRYDKAFNKGTPLPAS